MASTKLKVKVKKKKLKIKKLIITLLLFSLLVLTAILILKMPVKNIYIKGNNIVKDQEIIDLAKLNDYPTYISTYFIKIKKNILKNEYIKNVTITRKLPSKIIIEIEEYKPICKYNDKIILSSSKQVDNDYNLDYLPYVINNIDSIYTDFVSNFSKIDNSVLLKISEIEYIPNEISNERFALYMIDHNLVYITLSKIDKINKYNQIVNELDGKIGIINLDSGDYVEIKG